MRSPLRSRERILLYGREGSGKTKACLDFASRMDDGIHIISNDNSIERLLETEYPELDVAERKTDRVNLYNVRGWEEYRDTVLEVWNSVGADDLIIVDNMTWPWDQVKTWYVKEVYGRDMADWAQQYREKLDTAKGHSVQESIFEDWSFINAAWYGLHSESLVLCPCHLIITANAKPMRTDGRTDAELKDMYSSVKMLPDTQKRVGAQVQTIIYLWSDSYGYWMNTKVKDRGREENSVEKSQWTNFVDDYLMEIAGWDDRPAKARGRSAPKTKVRRKE